MLLELNEEKQLLHSIKRRKVDYYWRYEEKQLSREGYYTRLCSRKKITWKTKKKTDWAYHGMDRIKSNEVVSMTEATDGAIGLFYWPPTLLEDATTHTLRPRLHRNDFFIHKTPSTVVHHSSFHVPDILNSHQRVHEKLPWLLDDRFSNRLNEGLRFINLDYRLHFICHFICLPQSNITATVNFHRNFLFCGQRTI